MPKEKKETIETKQKIILPSSGDSDTDQELIDNFLSHSDEEYRQMGEEIEEVEIQQQKEQEQKKRNLNPEKMFAELPEYTKQVKENFLNLKGIDKNKLERIDKLVSEMESKGYIKRCSFELGLMVLIDIPGYPTFKYFEPNVKKHSMNGYLIGSSNPYAKKIPRKFGDHEIEKYEIICGGMGLLPIRTSRDKRENDILYYYLANTMKENNLSFVSFRHDRKFLKILGEYYRKNTGDSEISTEELIAMRTRVLLSCGYWVEKSEGGFHDGVIECADDKCGFNFLFGPPVFTYMSFFLTDLELLPEDYAGGYYDTTNL